MAVTTNLYGALSMLRSSSSLALWVDAICINQDNVLERNSQVQLMKDIYSSAQVVCAWLGSEGDGSAMGMDFIKIVAQERAALKNVNDNVEWLEKHGFVHADVDDDSDHPWFAFGKLLGRDYWQRVWCAQEVILATKVLIMCGDRIVTWEDVMTTYAWSKKIQQTAEVPNTFTMELWHLWKNTIRSIPTTIEACNAYRRSRVDHGISSIRGWGALVLSRWLQATDPRDNVYGLLGIMQVPLEPDYSRLVENVYIEAALRSLDSQGLTFLLWHAGLVQESQRKLPSWVPDWSSDRWPSWKLPDNSTRALSVRSSELNSSTHNPHVLRLRGRLFAPICRVDPVPTKESHTGHVVASMNLCMDLLHSSGHQGYLQGVSSLLAVMQLVLGAEDPFNKAQELTIPSEEFFIVAAAFVFTLGVLGHEDSSAIDFTNGLVTRLATLGLDMEEGFAASLSKSFLGSTSILGPWATGWHAMRQLLANNRITTIALEIQLIMNASRFIHIQNGYIGRAPEQTQVDDILYLLEDCDGPVVLRKVESHFLLVGICYVQGLMQGELQEKLRDETQLEEIELW